MKKKIELFKLKVILLLVLIGSFIFLYSVYLVKAQNVTVTATVQTSVT